MVIWEPIGRKDKNAYGIVVCNGFSFIGMVTGDWHKGRGVLWKTKAGSHSWQQKKKKKRKRAIEARYERVFICLSG